MKNKKNNILDILSKISDLQFQNDVWIKQKYWDRILNFGEAVNTLDDYWFFDDVETGVIKFSEPENQNKLNKFIEDLLAYQEDISHPGRMLKDQKWIEIVREAKNIYNLLKDIDWN